MYLKAEKIIETIATNKARQFKKIAWLDEEDIKQEVRLKCFRTLHRYDPDRADMHTFLSKCADNRIRDIRRGILYKHNKPCFRCPLWDKAASMKGEHDCLGFFNKMDCDKFARHERYVQTKLSASHPLNIDDAHVEDDGFESHIERSELIEYVWSCMPPEHYPIFKIFEKSNFNLKVLKPKERIILSEIIVEILQDYQEELYDD